MSILQTQIIDTLKSIFIQSEKKMLFAIASIDGIDVEGNRVRVSLSIKELPEDTLAEIENTVRNRLKQIGAEEVELDFNVRKQPKIKYIIAIGSGKGGVGKSTVTTNIAVALSRFKKRVGIMDADLYGPNIPMMFGVNRIPGVSPERKLIPLENHGVKLISLGFLLEDPSTPVIWRGPLITKAIEQLFYDVDWGELDFLLIDLPPGTGDISISIAQSIPTEYGIIVTTPQEVSFSDASKALVMFQKMNIEVLGVVENMSYFKCPSCGAEHSIFGSGAGEKLSKIYSVPLLGKIPIEPEMREGGDTGKPVFLLEQAKSSREKYLEITAAILQKLP